MKKIKILTVFAGLALLFAAEFEAKAFGDPMWDTRLCVEIYPNGTNGLGAGCVFPDPDGPCRRTTGCLNVVIQEE